MKYDHKAIDKKWQDAWMEAKAFVAENGSKKDPFYCLVEFPYPSGAGLHMGHPRSYTAIDVLARKRRMEGFNVLYPMGWDAFGLPTENFAIKTGRKPQEVTAENVATFKRQLQSLGLSFDWDREVNTTDPKYYKWTQWMFLEFFKEGLAYKDKMAINWCLSCKIGLANEEVVNGACERCGGDVEKRDKEQWMIAITKYADRLLSDLDTVDYLPKIKKQQQDWIGRSEGARVRFALKDVEQEIEVFTTRPDTLFGATYMVLAPEHALIHELENRIENIDEVKTYVQEAAKKSEIDRTNDEKEKTGVELKGVTAINPVNGKEIPVWVADYVLAGYGTGAVMAVPAHDERDFAFASKYGIEIVQVVAPPALTMPAGVADQQAGKLTEDVRLDAECYTGDGEIVNSNFLNGLTVEDARTKITDWLEQEGKGGRSVNYKLRDWVFSRQRYWGEPIPMVKCAGGCGKEHGGWVPVPEDQLPVVLPEVEKYEPTDDGESPLAAITDWVTTTCPECGGPGERETDTMPNWAGSSWYFLRYLDPNNDEAFASKEALDYWMPVNWYNGGMEHTTLHLLYSRFWNKVMFDRGHVPSAEPYAKRTSHGLIMAEDGTKMSKSKGNVVNPDELVEEFGADALRLLELFIGPFAEPAPYSHAGMVGMRRFLEKVITFVEKDAREANDETHRASHKLVKEIGEGIETMKYNTCVSKLMTWLNLATSKGTDKDTFGIFLKLLSPFAPHMAEEAWARIGRSGLVCQEPWPSFDEELAKDELVTIGVQVNGKVRGDVTLAPDAPEDEAREAALAIDAVQKQLEGKEMKKFIYVPGKIVSIVV